MAGVKHSVQTALPNDPASEISATAWNAEHAIDDNSVASAKVAFTATDKVLGRATAGAGAGEEIALTAAARTVLDDATVAAMLATLGGLPLGGGTLTGLLTTNGQIAFPATENPSADANTLDDYEEGAFTPTVTFATVGNLAVVHGTQSGQYVKIGSAVLFKIQIATTTFTHTTAAGNLRVAGLPFASGSTYYGGCLMGGYTKANYTQLQAQLTAGNSYIEVLAGGSGQATVTLAVADVPTAGTVAIRIFGYYRI